MTRPRLDISDEERRLRIKETKKRSAQSARDKKKATAGPIVRLLLSEEQKSENRRIVLRAEAEKRRKEAKDGEYKTRRNKIRKCEREIKVLTDKNNDLQASLEASRRIFSDQGVLCVQSIVGDITFDEMLKVLKDNSVEGVTADWDPNNLQGK
jgi:hypothetical protein